jgi:hypothetical protein
MCCKHNDAVFFHVLDHVPNSPLVYGIHARGRFLVLSMDLGISWIVYVRP